MKILIIQENGRHEANRSFRECFSLERAFIKCDNEVVVWGLGHANYNSNINFNEYDMIFNLENYGDGWMPNLSNVDGPLKILWSIDAHCRGVSPYENIFSNDKYNLMLHSTKDYVKHSYHMWFPNSFDNSLIKPNKTAKKHKFGFCGNIVNRGHILEILKNSYGLHTDIFVIGEDMVNAINSYVCHFNMNIANDINYRSFETIGCKTLLITNKNYQYDELGFVHNENCLIYDSFDHLYEIIKNIDKYNIDQISQNGYELSKNHTYDVRVKNLVAQLKNKGYI